MSQIDLDSYASYKFQVSDDAENEIRLKLFSRLQRKKKQGEFNLTIVQISLKENQQLCHVMNYMTTFFVCELSAYHVSVYYGMFLKNKRMRKKKHNMRFYL